MNYAAVVAPPPTHPLLPVRRGEKHNDFYAGGGGASTGYELATGKPVYSACNHDADAIAMHKANHPRTKHLLQAGGGSHAMVTPWVFPLTHRGAERAYDPRGPFKTITGAHLNRGDNAVGGMTDLLRTIVSGGMHAALIASFLRRYIGPKLAALEGKSFGYIQTADGVELVWVSIYGEPWIVTDIWMRMLFPREFFNGNGFPVDYILTGSKTSQIARCGNAVPPPLAAAIIRANTP